LSKVSRQAPDEVVKRSPPRADPAAMNIQEHFVALQLSPEDVLALLTEQAVAPSASTLQPSSTAADGAVVVSRADRSVAPAADFAGSDADSRPASQRRRRRRRAPAELDTPTRPTSRPVDQARVPVAADDECAPLLGEACFEWCVFPAHMDLETKAAQWNLDRSALDQAGAQLTARRYLALSDYVADIQRVFIGWQLNLSERPAVAGDVGELQKQFEANIETLARSRQKIFLTKFADFKVGLVVSYVRQLCGFS
jgi:hypothetical protein